MPKSQTTFLLLTAGEDTTASLLASASSDAGKAFNDALRSVNNIEHYQSQLFGWCSGLNPATPRYQASERHIFWESTGRHLVWFINWSCEFDLNSDQLRTRLAKALDLLSPYFQIPALCSPGLDLSTPESLHPLCLHINWQQGDGSDVLIRSQLPLELSLTDDTTYEVPSPSADASLAEAQVVRVVVGRTSVSEDAERRQVKVEVRLLDRQESVDGKGMACSGSKVSLVVELTRARWCTRIRDEMFEKIRARRIED